VVVSHLHGDHFGGLPFLILDGQFTHRTRPLHVAGPAGVRERVLAAMEVLFPGSTGVRRRFPVHFHQLTDREPFRFGRERSGLVVVPYEVVHASGAPALGLQVTWHGHTIAYTGDTEWTEALVELARGADLLIAEGYTNQRKIRFHLDVATLRQHASRLAARRVILTHLSAELLARADELGWETASDGMTLELVGAQR
jgi:ribonuclease BN (tRNA processing enzyme)